MFVEDQSGWALGEDTLEVEGGGARGRARTCLGADEVTSLPILQKRGAFMAARPCPWGPSHLPVRREGTWQGGGEFLGDTGSWGTLPPFSSALCGTQGSARLVVGGGGGRRGGGGE